MVVPDNLFGEAKHLTQHDLQAGKWSLLSAQILYNYIFNYYKNYKMKHKIIIN